jgi:hypothetical protein
METLEAKRSLALERVRATQSVVQDAERARFDAIKAAADAGCALRDVADATGNALSYEFVRRTVGDRADVVFEWRGTEYEIAEPQVRALAYKADGYGRNAFPGDVTLLGVGDGWLAASNSLAWEIQKRHARVISEPVVLDDASAFALCQILRLTYMTRPSRLADLADTLYSDFDMPGTVLGLRKRGG